MENNEFRGLNDGIILYVLKSGDRHTDELKAIIDEKFFEIKTGTLYSVITRLKNNKYLDEYRSSSDGSRRKYFTITTEGITYFVKNFSDKFENAPKIEKREERVVSEPVVKKPTVKPTVEQNTINDYENYVLNAQNNEYVNPVSEIDFSQITDYENFNVLEQPKPEEPVTAVQVPEEKPTALNENVENLTEFVEPTPSYTYESPSAKPEIDYDNVNDTSFEYRNVLNVLFPKHEPLATQTAQSNFVTEAKPMAMEENEQIVINEVTSSLNATQSANADFDDIYTYAERDGIQIKTSSDTNRYQGSKILHNLLRFHTSLIWFGAIIIEYLLLSLFFSGSVQFNGENFLKLCIFTAVVPIICSIVYFTNTRYAVKDLPRFKEVIEITLILAISAIIITIALSSIMQIDYANVESVFHSVVTPILVAVNAPIFYVIKYFLAKLDFYETI